MWKYLGRLFEVQKTAQRPEGGPGRCHSAAGPREGGGVGGRGQVKVGRWVRPQHGCRTASSAPRAHYDVLGVT